MILLYGDRCSFVLLRPKNEVKLSTQSADKWICMGKWPVPCGAILFLGLQKGPSVQIFSGGPFATNAIPEKLARANEGTGSGKKL